MKKLFTKMLPLSMAIIMAFGSIIPVFATVNEKQTVNTGSTSQTEVVYNQESTFSVILPKLIDLGIDKTTDYTVTVTGDISSDETIFVVPDDSFYMKDKNTSNPKDDVEAVVTQNKTEWKFNELETIGNGNVTAENLTAGTWEGKFYFNIKLKNCNISVTATNEAGENLNASATYITGVEKDNLLNSLEESGLIESKEDVDALINVNSDDFDGLADTTFDVSDIAKEGETVAILHFDETKGEWELIGTETVDENGLVSGDFTSYSPVAFVIVKEDGTFVTHTEHIDENNDSFCDICNKEGTIIYTYHTHIGDSSSEGGCYNEPVETNYGTTSSTSNVKCSAKIVSVTEGPLYGYVNGVWTQTGYGTPQGTCYNGHTTTNSIMGVSVGESCQNVIGTTTITKCKNCGSTSCNGIHITSYNVNCGKTEETVESQTTIFE